MFQTEVSTSIRLMTFDTKAQFWTKNTNLNKSGFESHRNPNLQQGKAHPQQRKESSQLSKVKLGKGNNSRASSTSQSHDFAQTNFSHKYQTSSTIMAGWEEFERSNMKVVTSSLHTLFNSDTNLDPRERRLTRPHIMTEPGQHGKTLTPPSTGTRAIAIAADHTKAN